MAFKRPETHKEIVENRKRALDALINEDPEAQCYGDLFAYAEDEDGDPIKDKEMRCAVGAIAKELLGINGVDDFDKYEAGGGLVYEEVAAMLGLGDTCEHIWKLNDRNGLTFAEIHTVLTAEWELDSK